MKHFLFFDTETTGIPKNYKASTSDVDNWPRLVQLSWITQDKYGEYKWPKLQELHKKLFGREFDDAHNSNADVEATSKCFWELVKRGIIRLY